MADIIREGEFGEYNLTWLQEQVGKTVRVYNFETQGTYEAVLKSVDEETDTCEVSAESDTSADRIVHAEFVEDPRSD